ncbi:MAG: glycosyltransferase family 2 protein [Aggregatilineales bacterium]
MNQQPAASDQKPIAHNHLTAIILAHNEAKHIQACIETLDFADRIIVFESFSTDNTVDLAKAAGADVIQHEFENFASQRNAALDAVAGQTDWVLFVDADERVTPELAAEVRQKITTPWQVVGYGIPRHNYIAGKLTKGAGWYPDHQTRLLKSGYAHYDPQRKVHETVILDGDEAQLVNHFIHFNYESMAQFREKQARYLPFDVQMMFDDGIRPKPQNYILQPLRHFKWRFFELRGYQDGWHGLRLSALMAWYELRKYLLLRQKLKG